MFYFLGGIVVAIIGLFFYIRNNRAQFEQIFGDVNDEVAKMKAELEKLKAKLPK